MKNDEVIFDRLTNPFNKKGGSTNVKQIINHIYNHLNY